MKRSHDAPTFDVQLPPLTAVVEPAFPSADQLSLFASEIASSTSASQLTNAMHRVVQYLLNHCHIQATTPDGATTNFRIVELELYVTHATLHNDPFTHVDPLQRRPGQFYFHRKGGTFKGGSFKGMDITFGTDAVPCGALIRSIAQVDGDGALTDGPSLVVDRLLAATGAAKIVDLVSPTDGSLATSGSAKTRLSLHHIAPADVLSRRAVLAPRVGLVPRADSTVAFAGALLRFVTVESAGKMKHRGGLIAGALAVRHLSLSASDANEFVAWVKASLGTSLQLATVSSWSETKATEKDVLNSDKLNTAAGASTLVLLSLRLGGLTHALPHAEGSGES